MSGCFLEVCNEWEGDTGPAVLEGLTVEEDGIAVATTVCGIMPGGAASAALGGLTVAVDGVCQGRKPGCPVGHISLSAGITENGHEYSYRSYGTTLHGNPED